MPVCNELIGVAHAHLRNALDYTLFIPAAETGIRRFCLWAIGLAVLTLRKIQRNPGFTAGSQVKISRSAVAMTRLLTDLSVRNDWLLRRLFAQAARGLPLAQLAEVRRPQSRARAGTRAPALLRELRKLSRFAGEAGGAAGRGNQGSRRYRVASRSPRRCRPCWIVPSPPPATR